MNKKMVLISVLALMLASCGSTTGEQDSKASTTKETTTTTTTSETISILESVPEVDSSEDMTETKAPIVTTELHNEDESLPPNEFEVTETKTLLEIEEEKKTVKASMSKDMIGSDPQNYINALLNEDGVIAAEINAEGGVDIVYTEEKYTEVCNKYKQSSQDIIDRMLDRGTYSTITSISYNDDLTEIYVTLTDYDAYQNSTDHFFKWQLGATAGLYHKFLQDDADVMIYYLDQDGYEYASESLY